jgi:hypothetical protein
MGYADERLREAAEAQIFNYDNVYQPPY